MIGLTSYRARRLYPLQECAAAEPPISFLPFPFFGLDSRTELELGRPEIQSFLPLIGLTMAKSSLNLNRYLCSIASLSLSLPLFSLPLPLCHPSSASLAFFLCLSATLPPFFSVSLGNTAVSLISIGEHLDTANFARKVCLLFSNSIRLHGVIPSICLRAHLCYACQVNSVAFFIVLDDFNNTNNRGLVVSRIRVCYN